MARQRARQLVEHGVDRQGRVEAQGQLSHQLVMPGLAPGIHVFLEQ